MSLDYCSHRHMVLQDSVKKTLASLLRIGYILLLAILGTSISVAPGTHPCSSSPAVFGIGDEVWVWGFKFWHGSSRPVLDLQTSYFQVKFP